MGVAAYHRTSKVIRQRIAEQDRPVEFEMMDNLNAMPKYADAGQPFGPIQFVHSHSGWWAECPKTGFGYWYPSLREAVRRWRCTIVGFNDGVWSAEPMRPEQLTIETLMCRR